MRAWAHRCFLTERPLNGHGDSTSRDSCWQVTAQRRRTPVTRVSPPPRPLRRPLSPGRRARTLGRREGTRAPATLRTPAARNGPAIPPSPTSFLPDESHRAQKTTGAWMGRSLPGKSGGFTKRPFLPLFRLHSQRKPLSPTSTCPCSSSHRPPECRGPHTPGWEWVGFDVKTPIPVEMNPAFGHRRTPLALRELSPWN